MNRTDAGNLLNLRTGVFGRLGSFWYTQTTPGHAEQLRTLARSAFSSALTQDILGTGGLACGDRPYSDFVTLPVSPGNLAFIGGDAGPALQALAGNPEGWLGVYSMPDNSHTAWTALFQENPEYTLLTEYNQVILWPDPDDGYQTKVRAVDLVDTWVLPVPQDFLVTRIQRQDGSWMVRGLEFQSEPGVILFYEHPTLWCPSQRASACGVRAGTNLIQYTQRVDGVPSPATWVSRWMRGSQSLSVFRRALAEASGLFVTTEAQVILGRLELPVGCLYYTDKQMISCAYPHTLLPVGYLLGAGEVIGSLEVTLEGNSLEITLDPDLFSGVFLRRAQQFIYREKPLGLYTSITEES